MKKIFPILLALIGAPLFSFMISNVSLKFGDKALLADQLFNARNWYSIAQITNPFNATVPNRLLAVSTQIVDRTNSMDEEANTVPKNINEVITPQHVLGITSCVPVLMYHYIRINPWPTDTVGYGLSTPPIAFAKQLDYLQSKGYQTITLSDLKGQIELKSAIERKILDPNVKLPHAILLPQKPLIITLDDGYKDAYTAAYPLLKARGMNAVDFVITGFIDLPNYLNWQQIKELDASRVIDIQSHTVHHYALAGRYWKQQTIDYELNQSRIDLENHLGKVVDWLAYPYGSVNPIVASETEKQYFGAFGTNFGSYQSTDALYTLPRIRVSGGDSGPSIDARIHQALLDAKCVQ